MSYLAPCRRRAFVFLSLYIALLHTTTITIRVEAAHSRRRVVSSQNNERTTTYDREITTFSPDGRLPQVEYGMEAIMQRGSPLGLIVHNNTVLIAMQSSFAKMHRLDDSKFLITTGLSGDGRLVARLLRGNCQNFLMQKGEVPTVKETAHMAASFLHGLTKKGGSRPLACRAVVVGIDEEGYGEDGTESSQGFRVRVFQTDPGGGMEECTDFLAVGKGQDALYRELQKIVDKESSKQKKSTASFLDRLASVARKLAAALERIGGGGRAPQKHTTSSPMDVWIVQPREGRRGNMLATVYSHSDANHDTSIDDLILQHHNEL